MNAPLRRWLGTATLAIALVALASPAWAGNQALMGLLAVLRDNGTIPQQVYEQLRAAAAAEDAACAHAAAGAGPGPGTASAAAGHEEAAKQTEVSFGPKGLAVESADGDYSFELGGRVHIDTAWYDDDKTDLGSGSLVRRLRLELGGHLPRDWEYSFGVDFGNNEVSMKSAYLTYTGLKPAEVSVGNFKEPFGLEELSSSNYITFMERNAITETFAPGRHVGLGATTHGETWMVAGGVYSGKGVAENDVDQGWSVTGRAVYSPIHDKTHALHLGAAVSHGGSGDEMFRFSVRPDSRVTDTKLVDTGDIAGSHTATLYGLEAAAVCGPLSLQGEYIAAALNRTMGLPDLDFSGWYAFLSWFLTGESRNYKQSRGTFGSLTPLRPFGEGGPGAWELGARFSHLDLTNADVIGGDQELLTLGVNWYLTQNVRFMANYVDVLNVDRPGSVHDNDEPSVVQVRGQLNF